MGNAYASRLQKMTNIQNSHIVWQGSSWRLRVDEVTLPSGYAFERGIVEHPGAVVLVPLVETDNGNEVLMIRQYRAALEETILELPAGTKGWQEEWLVCAQRELREETGYRAEQLTKLGRFWPAPGLSSEVMTLYLATQLTHDPLPADADEEIEVVPMALAELVTMAWDGRLRDGKSFIGILLTAKHLKL
jgi:ADP-ribose pyrophosphatase